MVKILISFSIKITVLQIHIKRKKLHCKVQIYIWKKQTTVLSTAHNLYVKNFSENLLLYKNIFHELRLYYQAFKHTEVK